MRENEINLLYYLRTANKHKRAIMVFMLVTVVLTVSLGLLEQRVYVATATFLMPMSTESPASISTSGIRSVLGSSGFNFSGFNSGGDLTAIIDAVVKSRRMAKAIVEEFDLQKMYGIDYETAIRTAIGMVRTYYLPGGATMAIEAKSGNPQFSADLANFTVSHLDKINQELDITSLTPIAKVLDPAITPLLPQPRQIKKKAIIALLASGLFGIIFSFFVEYIKRLKEETK